MGTTHQFLLQGGSYRWKWVAGCQMRADTNGDGAVDSYVTIRGAIVGDVASVYLWSGDGHERLIDEFVAQSPSGRYAAYVERGRLFVMDGATRERTDLTDFGALVVSDEDPKRPSFGVAFSYGHWCAFLRREEGRTQIVGLDLVTREQRVLHESTRHVNRLMFDPEGAELIVVEKLGQATTKKSDGPLALSVRGQSRCRSLPPEQEISLLVGVVWPETRVGVAHLPDLEQREEILLRSMASCIADGRRVLARSSLGGLLVGAATGRPSGALERGPVQWVRAIDVSSETHCLQFPAPSKRSGPWRGLGS